MNGLTDPRLASSGGVPTGFAQWMTFYKNYRVLQATAHVWFWRFQANVGESPYPVVFYLRGKAFGTTAPTANYWLDSVLELPKDQVFKVCSGFHNQAQPDKMVHLKKTWNVAKVQGYTDDANMLGSAASNPANLPTIEIGACKYDSNATANGNEVQYFFLIRIGYTVRFEGLQNAYAAY